MTEAEKQLKVLQLELDAKIAELKQANRELQQELERIDQVHDCNKNAVLFKTTGANQEMVLQCQICAEVLEEIRL